MDVVAQEEEDTQACQILLENTAQSKIGLPPSPPISAHQLKAAYLRTKILKLIK